MSPYHYLILFFVLVVIVAIIGGGVLLIVKAVKSSNKTPAQAVAPGWYPDGVNPQLIRWHDGKQWTDQVRSR